MPKTIKEAAELTGLSAYTIRYYERVGILGEVFRDSQGNRTFEDADIDWMGYIVCLRHTGMSISQMQKIAELTREGDGTIPLRRRLLEEHRRLLKVKIRNIQNAFDRLEHKIAYYTEMEKKTAKKAAPTGTLTTV